MYVRDNKNVKDQLLQNKLEYWQKMTFSFHFLDSVTLTLTFRRSLQIQCHILTVVSYKTFETNIKAILHQTVGKITKYW